MKRARAIAIAQAEQKAQEARLLLTAGLLMHAVHLGGSHYTQYLGMSAGITAVLLSVQPLITALVAGWIIRKNLDLVRLIQTQRIGLATFVPLPLAEGNEPHDRANVRR